jgi:hypothetical protein
MVPSLFGPIFPTFRGVDRTIVCRKLLPRSAAVSALGLAATLHTAIKSRATMILPLKYFAAGARR